MANTRKATSASPVEPPALDDKSFAAALLVEVKAVGALRSGAEPSGAVLDAIALASTALTGHPLTATTSVLVGAAAERWRDSLVAVAGHEAVVLRKCAAVSVGLSGRSSAMSEVIDPPAGNPASPMAPAVAALIDAAEREARIAIEAFYLAEARGFEPGHELDDRLLAEWQIDQPTPAD